MGSFRSEGRHDRRSPAHAFVNLGSHNPKNFLRALGTHGKRGAIDASPVARFAAGRAVRFKAPRKTVASEEPILSKIGRVAGAQEPECAYQYTRMTRRIRDSPSGPFAARMFAPASCLRSPSTAGAQIVERSRFFEVPSVEAIVARVHLRVFHFHRELRDRLLGRRAHHVTRAQVEARAMARTFDLEAVHLATGQLAAVVRADVLDRVELAVDVEHRDRGVAVPDDLEFPRQQFGLGADANPAAHDRALTAASPAIRT